MASYADSLKAHLTAYKRERLGVLEDGLWLKNQRPYSHILPERLKRLNVLETIRREFWQFQQSPETVIRLHSDFHHLNSSQALAFNLFFPFFGLRDVAAEPLLGALGIRGRNITKWLLEAVPDPSEGTNFDFFAEFSDGGRLLIEVKLSEAGFGACSPDDSHRAKLRDTYTPRLADAVVSGALAEEAFFPNYQLFRNVSHLARSGKDLLVLLLPRANEGTWSCGEVFCESLLAASTRARVRLVAVEDVLRTLAASIDDGPGRVSAHIELMAEKYLIQGAA